MLRIYDKILFVLRALRPVIATLEQHDRDLARQLRRCAPSIALNSAEASGCRAGTRRQRHHDALGSARETRACLDAAIALGYIDSLDAALLDALDHICATLYRLT